MFYKNCDYTVRAEARGGCKKYYIRFHGQVDSPEVEVELEIFDLYLKVFSRPLERQRNEQRRHIDYRELNLSAIVDCRELWEQVDVALDIAAILQTCTPIQRRRFNLYICGYSLDEIAKIENRKIPVVQRSIKAVQGKVKNIFLGMG